MTRYPFLIAHAAILTAFGVGFAIYCISKDNHFGTALAVVYTLSGVVLLRCALTRWAADRRHRAIQEELDR